MLISLHGTSSASNAMQKTIISSYLQCSEVFMIPPAPQRRCLWDPPGEHKRRLGQPRPEFLFHGIVLVGPGYRPDMMSCHVPTIQTRAWKAREVFMVPPAPQIRWKHYNVVVFMVPPAPQIQWKTQSYLCICNALEVFMVPPAPQTRYKTQ